MSLIVKSFLIAIWIAEVELFFCKDGKSINWSNVCNGYFDCAEQSDELNCRNHSCPSIAEQFQCEDSGQCIPFHVQCNGFNDCVDSSDEKYQGCQMKINAYEFASKNSVIAVWGIINMVLGICGNLMTIVAIPFSMWKRRHGIYLSLIHIWRCRRSYACRSRWSPYH